MWPDLPPRELPCQLCGRLFDKDRLTRHHCLPKSKGGTPDDVELVCGQCHAMVHATYTNATLAAVYPTIDDLRRAPELTAFVRWVRKQPVGRKAKVKTRRERI